MGAYETFDLRVTRHSAGEAEVTLLDSPAGSGFTHIFQIPDLSLRSGFGPRGRAGPGQRSAHLLGAGGESPVASAREIGRTLFGALFGGPLAERLRRSRAGLREGRRLRVRLRLPAAAPELEGIPWEYLYDSDDRDFLAAHSKLSLVRFVEGGGISQPLEATLPLRLLVVTAQPKHCEGLEVGQELEHLGKALKPLGKSIRMEILQNPDLETLREKLSTGGFHLLHFLGHGTVSPQGEGCLVLVAKDGTAQPVESPRIKLLLEEVPGLRLVVLNCCEGGVSPACDPAAGVARTLLLAGVPAVVAMQARVSDRTAVTFAGHFYRKLAATGSVERAMTEARKSLFLDDSTLAEWGVPVLFLRSETGQLFDFSRRRWPWASGLGAVILAALAIGFWLRDRSAPEPPAEPTAIPIPAELKPSDEQCPSPAGLSLVYVAKGSFQRGEGREAHRVVISRPFCIGRYEVTQEQWNQIRSDGRRGLLSAPDRLPAAKVSWLEAVELTRRLTASTGVPCRLPTEAEWEYAAQAGSTAAFSFGDDPRDLPRFGNCGGEKDHYDEVAPIGSFLPNRWGIHDMQGNVAEWVQDWYADFEPIEVTDPQGPSTGTLKIRRGGGYDIKPENCGVASRNKGKPEIRRQAVGLRVVCAPLGAR
jgi:formylglycine-generating enzyme required for sulfatase activity